MKTKDKIRLGLLKRALTAWSGEALGIESMQQNTMPTHDLEREAFEGVSILLEMQTLGDTVWVTAEVDGATLMMPFDVGGNGGFHEYMMNGNVNETFMLPVN